MILMKKFWPFSYYFLFFAALCSLMPFTALYYQGLGLSGSQIGILTSIGPLLSLVGAPLLTGLADATHRHKLMFNLSTASVIVIMLVFPTAKTFWAIIPILVLYFLIGSPVISLADSATMSMLGEEKALYGRVRVGGTIGWGIMATIAGLVIERSGILWMFWLYCGLMTLALLFGQGLVFGKAKVASSFRSGMRTILTDRRWVLFLVMMFINGIGMASINTYLFVYMREIGTSESLMGIALTISTLSEVPVMFFSNWLLKRLSPCRLLMLGMAVVSLRLLLYAAFAFPAAVLLIQLIHGLTYPLIMVAGVSFANDNAPPGMSATAQGLYGAALMGFGAAAGSLLGGVLIENTGGRGMYLTFGLLVLIGLLFFTLLERRTQKSACADTQ
jgi:PPP family 3-phenylpropionic acid transporter